MVTASIQWHAMDGTDKHYKLLKNKMLTNVITISSKNERVGFLYIQLSDVLYSRHTPKLKIDCQIQDEYKV